jgi:hypothetical protein
VLGAGAGVSLGGCAASEQDGEHCKHWPSDRPRKETPFASLRFAHLGVQCCLPRDDVSRNSRLNRLSQRKSSHAGWTCQGSHSGPSAQDGSGTKLRAREGAAARSANPNVGSGSITSIPPCPRHDRFAGKPGSVGSPLMGRWRKVSVWSALSRYHGPTLTDCAENLAITRVLVEPPGSLWCMSIPHQDGHGNHFQIRCLGRYTNGTVVPCWLFCWLSSRGKRLVCPRIRQCRPYCAELR